MPTAALRLHLADDGTPRQCTDAEAFRRADGIDALALLVERHTLDTVHGWLEQIAMRQGRSLPDRKLR